MTIPSRQAADQPPAEMTPGQAPTRRPRRGGRGEVAARVALVLVLLGIAVAGLSGRRELDWEAISDAPGSSWIGLLLIAAATFVVVSSVRALGRLLRVNAEADDDDAVESIEGRRVPWYAHLAAVLVVALAILLVYLLVRSAVEEPDPKFRDQGKVITSQEAQRPRSGDQNSTDTWLLLSAALVGAVLAVVGVRRRGEDAEDADDRDEEPTEQQVLAGAVAAAEVELDSHGDDTRAAIIAAYLAMERQLVAGGTTRQASDTPTDFLLRATAASRVSRGAATRLTELFREARFSTHPMAETARADAARALARVADDLATLGELRPPSSRQEQTSPKAGPRG